MAVLVEGISVIIRRARIEALYPGGWESFAADCPNQTLCADNDIARMGFMAPADVETFVRHLESLGFVSERDGEAVDLVVVDQRQGLATRCSWIEYGHVEVGGHRVAACQVKGCVERVLITPEGWEYERSLTARYGFVPMGEEKERVVFLGHRGGLDVYLDLLTGKEVYVGRTRPGARGPEGPGGKDA